MRNARNIRETKGLTLRDATIATGLDSTHISKFERGEVWLGGENLVKLAGYYGCTVDDLIRDAEAPDADPAPAVIVAGE